MLRVVRLNEPVYAQFASRRTHAAGCSVFCVAAVGLGGCHQFAAGQNPDGGAGRFALAGVIVFV